MSGHCTKDSSTLGEAKDRIAVLEALLGHARLLVLAPHMDDETLGCGGTLALHSDPSRVYCLFATDGSRSPAPLLPWTGKVDLQLPTQRKREAIAALSELGVREANLIFLNLPDGRLSSQKKTLTTMLSETVGRLHPDVILAPFRLDVHPDHVILNRVARSMIRGLAEPPVFAEYFVYNRLRLLPEGDILSWISPSSLVRIGSSASSAAKMRALQKYRTQITLTQPWQERPVLTEDRLQERCAAPEYFLFGDPGAGLLQPFPRHRLRILAAYLAQRFGKRPKDRLLALVRQLGRMSASS